MTRRPKRRGGHRAGRRARARPVPLDEDAAKAIWQYLRRLEEGIDHIEARIDRLYVAIGGGCVGLAAIGLAAGFIARGG